MFRLAGRIETVSSEQPARFAAGLAANLITTVKSEPIANEQNVAGLYGDGRGALMACCGKRGIRGSCSRWQTFCQNAAMTVANPCLVIDFTQYLTAFNTLFLPKDELHSRNEGLLCPYVELRLLEFVNLLSRQVRERFDHGHDGSADCIRIAEAHETNDIRRRGNFRVHLVARASKRESNGIGTASHGASGFFRESAVARQNYKIHEELAIVLGTI
ncbi:hypothetical protein [Paraburkholderia hospita]|uniref:hypothetical protein n=1 Tax=Paraburkholderia hospita TaxID=169430 RepID=UPI000271D7B9|nr:hypothetical protein [Paraburkholderia hospita]EUC18608.1 hypothetical protein PMI06_003233 [Burkholderia sp. BT03]SKC60242.1 hypothetical protein SAMN06266956_1100 [Paraburkholderia hospita]